MSQMINLKINNIPVTVERGATILDAARKANFKIPTLCHHSDICDAGNCRVCVVEQVGVKNLQASCAVPAAEGMEIITNNEKVRKARKHIIELLLSEHNTDCTKCYKNGKCELQSLSSDYAVGENQYIDLVCEHEYKVDSSSLSIIKDDSKCIRCQRCVRVCKDLQHVAVIAVAGKGSEQRVTTFHDKPMANVVCTNCGQCIIHCPTGALVEKCDIDYVFDAISNPNSHVVVQTAPAVRVALGEELGFEHGERVTGKLVSALKQLGFDSVLDTDFSADLTIIEEGHELLTRLKKVLVDGDKETALPLITSCSPGWIKFVEHQFSDMLPNLSTCKSPQQMFGALAKTYYAEQRKLDPAKIVSVSVMPCTAKKFEANRPEMNDSGYQDVDYSITTRELARMIKQTGIEFKSLPDNKYDNIMGDSTGAGVIFAASGGVMEAALRTAYEIITGREVPFKNLDIMPVRGMEGVKEAKILIEDCVEDWKFLEGATLSVAIANGLENAHKVMTAVKNGTASYHFIEIMGCPGGCIGGGGQPIPTNQTIRDLRAAAIYEEDRNMPIRKSHENPEITKIYEEFLIEPLGHKSHKLLHTTYVKRDKY